MKVRFKQKTLIDVLAKGAIAALTEEAQTDTTGFAPLLKSVKIKVESNAVTIESAIKTLAVHYKYPFSSEEVTVKEEGEVMVLAKDLIDWAKKQADSDILLNLKPFDSPQLVSSMDGDGSSKASIKKLGTVELISRDQTKSGTKWSLDCFDASQITWVNFQTPDVLFEIDQELLKTAVKSTEFASIKDNDHVRDAFAFQIYKNNLYMSTGDGVRMALYDLKGSKVNNLNFIYTVPCSTLSSVIDLFASKEPVQFGFDDKKRRAFIFQKDYIVRADTADQANIDAKVAPLTYVYDQLTFDKFAKITKGILASRLSTASMVNKESVLYVFKGGQVLLHAISEKGVAPNTCTAPLKEHSRDVKVLWAVPHIMEVIKAIPDDEISMSMPPDSTKILRIDSQQDPRFTYLAREQVIKGTKYDSIAIE
jgi:DNA polymerase III sliding clamp (beta) subunit (PCNA family)